MFSFLEKEMIVFLFFFFFFVDAVGVWGQVTWLSWPRTEDGPRGFLQVSENEVVQPHPRARMNVVSMLLHFSRWLLSSLDSLLLCHGNDNLNRRHFIKRM
jgi:hypothetical protein